MGALENIKQTTDLLSNRLKSLENDALLSAGDTLTEANDLNTLPHRMAFGGWSSGRTPDNAPPFTGAGVYLHVPASNITGGGLQLVKRRNSPDIYYRSGQSTGSWTTWYLIPTGSSSAQPFVPVLPNNDTLKWVTPGDEPTYTYSSGLTMTAGRIYYVPFVVEKAIEVLSASIAVYTAGLVGAVMRGGIYNAGAADNNDWQVGTLVSDFGTTLCDFEGHLTFTPPSQLILQPGRYMTAYGTNLGSCRIDYARQMSKGRPNRQYGTGTGVSHRGAVYFYRNSQAAEILAGFSAENIRLTDAQSGNGFMYQGMLLERNVL